MANRIYTDLAVEIRNDEPAATQRILAALQATGGSIQWAAKALGVSTRTLSRILESRERLRVEAAKLREINGLRGPRKNRRVGLT